MQITFECTCGFETVKLCSSFNTWQADSDETTKLRRLIKQLDFFNLPELIRETRNAETFQCTVTVRDGSRKHTVSLFGEPTSDAWGELIGMMRELAEMKPNE